MLQFYLAKVIKRIEFQGNSTRYFCSMLQFYLTKVIKRSEFDYADFDYMMGMGNESYRQGHHSQRLMSFPKMNIRNHPNQ